jgi:hypothetical protein
LSYRKIVTSLLEFSILLSVLGLELFLWVESIIILCFSFICVAGFFFWIEKKIENKKIETVKTQNHVVPSLIIDRRVSANFASKLYYPMYQYICRDMNNWVSLYTSEWVSEEYGVGNIVSVYIGLRDKYWIDLTSEVPWNTEEAKQLQKEFSEKLIRIEQIKNTSSWFIKISSMVGFLCSGFVFSSLVWIWFQHIYDPVGFILVIISGILFYVCFRWLWSLFGSRWSY